jgi:hypothetical protein
MRRLHGPDPHGVVTLAALLAVLFAARRRAAKRQDAWHPITLYWRQKRRRLESVRAPRLALTAGAVMFAQFHLHFAIRSADGAPRRSTHLLPIAADRQTRIVVEHPGTVTQPRTVLAQLRSQPAVQTRGVMEHRRTITQSRMVLVQPYRAQSIPSVSSPGHAQIDWGTKLHTTARSSVPTRQPIVPAIATRGAVRRVLPLLGPSRIVNRPLSPDLGGVHSHLRPGETMDGKDRNFQAVQAYPIGPPLYRSRAAVMRHPLPAGSQESIPAHLNFPLQTLVWCRPTQANAENPGNRRQGGLDALEEQSRGRSLTGKEAAFEMPHTSGNSPATPAIKIDSALIDRLTDDVIRRVERRARIERARQGL